MGGREGSEEGEVEAVLLEVEGGVFIGVPGRELGVAAGCVG